MREIALTRGYVAFVSDRDYKRVLAYGPWFIHSKKRERRSNKRLVCCHQPLALPCLTGNTHSNKTKRRRAMIPRWGKPSKAQKP